MARIEGVDPEHVDPATKAAFVAQTERWGAPLLAHLLYARRPTIYRAVRAMWGGLDQSGLLDPGLVALVNRRVAAINGCVF
jgi:alkylhydroperoxidase family enzyme